MTKEEYAQMLEAMWKRTVAEPQNAEDSRIFLRRNFRYNVHGRKE